MCTYGLVYIGETTMEIRQRISKHKSTVRTRMLELPILKHFAEKARSVKQLKYQVTDYFPPLRRGGDRQAWLLAKELRWIHKTDCLHPRGLNVEFKLHGMT